MIRRFNGKIPKIAESAFISEAAYIVGDVEIGENSSVWPGAVIRGDFAKIRIGNNSVIEDNCVLHGTIEIGDTVILGHGVVMHGKKIGNNTLVGNNATILGNAEIGALCVIGAGCVVSEGMKVPDRSFVVGVPGEIKGESLGRHLQWMQGGPHAYIQLAREFKEQGL